MSTSRRTTQTHRQPQETSQGRERSWSKTGIYRTRYTRVRALHISLYFVLVEQYRYHLMYRYSNSRARSYHTTRAAVPGFGHISAHPAVRWFQEIVQSVLISELQREHRSNVRKGRQKGGKERRHRVLEQVQHRSLQISLHVCSAAHFVANAAHLADPKEQTEREYNSVPKYRDHFYMNNTYKRTYIYGQSGTKLCWKSRGGGTTLLTRYQGIYFSYAGPQQSPGKPSPHPTGMCFVAEVGGLRMQGSGLSGRCPSLLGHGVGGPGLARAMWLRICPPSTSPLYTFFIVRLELH